MRFPGDFASNDGRFGAPVVLDIWFFTSPTLTVKRVEKYRPAVLDDVVGNEEIVSRLKVIAKTGNMPHILLSVARLIAFVCCVIAAMLGFTWYW